MPPAVGLAVGYGAGDLLGVAGLTEGFLTKYTEVDADAINKLSSVVAISVYVAGWASFRGKGMISNTIAWTCLGVAFSEAMALKAEVA